MTEASHAKRTAIRSSCSVAEMDVGGCWNTTKSALWRLSLTWRCSEKNTPKFKHQGFDTLMIETWPTTRKIARKMADLIDLSHCLRPPPAAPTQWLGSWVWRGLAV